MKCCGFGGELNSEFGLDPTYFCNKDFIWCLESSKYNWQYRIAVLQSSARIFQRSMATATRSQTAADASTLRNTPPVSVLFVCLGNICRSPMAEGVFRALTSFSTKQQHPLISNIDSCGTGAYHAGDQPDSRTLAVLADYAGITTYRHKARRIKVPSDFEQYDYIIAMDEDNLIDLRDMVKRAKKRGLLSGDELNKVGLFGSFGGKSVDEEVQDPYYGGKDGFEIAFEQVERCGKGLLKHIEAQAKVEQSEQT